MSKINLSNDERKIIMEEVRRSADSCMVDDLGKKGEAMSLVNRDMIKKHIRLNRGIRYNLNYYHDYNGWLFCFLDSVNYSEELGIELQKNDIQLKEDIIYVIVDCYIDEFKKQKNVLERSFIKFTEFIFSHINFKKFEEKNINIARKAKTIIVFS